MYENNSFFNIRYQLCFFGRKKIPCGDRKMGYKSYTDFYFFNGINLPYFEEKT